MLMEPGGMMSSAQLGQPVTLPIYNTRQHVTAADKSRRVSFDFLHGPTAAVIGSALLMLLIGWIDYRTTDFAITLFYFAPVVLATWRAGRKAGWFIAALCGATVLMADLMVPRSGHVIALAYINAGILLLASSVLAELVISSRRAHERLKTLLALKTVSLTEIHHRVKNNLQIVSSLLRLQSGKFADPAAREVFAECRDRINAMARLHEQLYNELGQSHLDFAPHLRELAEMLLHSHKPADCKLTLGIFAERTYLLPRKSRSVSGSEDLMTSHFHQDSVGLLERWHNKTLDRMTRSAVSRMFQCERPRRAPRHRSALRSA